MWSLHLFLIIDPQLYFPWSKKSFKLNVYAVNIQLSTASYKSSDLRSFFIFIKK